MGLKASLNLMKPILNKAKYIKPELTVLQTDGISKLSGVINSNKFFSLLDTSSVFSKIKQSILKYAPLSKHETLLNAYKEFCKNSQDVKVIEQLYQGIYNELTHIIHPRTLERLNIAWGKDCKHLSEAEIIQIYNKAFKNISILRKNNPQEYEIMVKGGFFDLVEQGKISSYNLATDFTNARISRSLLGDLKKAAKNESFIPNYSSLSVQQIKTIVQEGEVYLKNGKLFTFNNGMEIEIQLSKEKFEELFPPILRHISNQGSIGNCWFVGKLDNLMSSTSGKGGIYSLFRQSGEDIYIKFPDCEKEILFPKGITLQSAKNKQMETVPGLAMLEQATAVHLGNKYEQNPVTKITNFDIDSLMEILVGHKRRMRKNPFEITRISGEYIDYIDIQHPQNPYIATSSVPFLENLFDAFGITLSKTKKKNIEIMQNLVEKHANNSNLKINAGFINTIPNEYKELYNMVPNHKLTIQAVENDSVWISNPWFNWIEKQIPKNTFYKYLDYIEVPIQWI